MSRLDSHRFNRRRVAELHEELVRKLSAMSPPGERTFELPSERAVTLRKDAAYLRDLQNAIAPLIEAVVDRAVTTDGIRDVTEAGTLPLETLDDNVLAEFERRAEEIEEENVSLRR